MTAVETAERLVRDIHPAELSLPDGTVIRDLRLFVTERRLVGWRVGANGLERAFELDLEQPCTVPRSRGTLQGSLEARLADGSTAWINRGRGCGCGSPLKALAPPVPW